jgi:hypothetical protein
MITQDELKELYEYNKDTGIFTARVHRSSRAVAGSVVSSRCGDYLIVCIKNKKYLAHRLAWLYVYGKLPTKFIDHINGKKDDNMINNLRECTKAQNQVNIGKLANNTTGFKGVSFVKENNNYRARIKIGNKYKHLGVRKTAEEASLLYEKEANKVHGEFYYKNGMKANNKQQENC